MKFRRCLECKVAPEDPSVHFCPTCDQPIEEVEVLVPDSRKKLVTPDDPHFI